MSVFKDGADENGFVYNEDYNSWYKMGEDAFIIRTQNLMLEQQLALFAAKNDLLSKETLGLNDKLMVYGYEQVEKATIKQYKKDTAGINFENANAYIEYRAEKTSEGWECAEPALIARGDNADTMAFIKASAEYKVKNEKDLNKLENEIDGGLVTVFVEACEESEFAKKLAEHKPKETAQNKTHKEKTTVDKER